MKALYGLNARTTGDDQLRYGQAYFLYLISFLCLLRSDEALGLKWSDIEFDPHDLTKIQIRLRTRKTCQVGGWYFVST